MIFFHIAPLECDQLEITKYMLVTCMISQGGLFKLARMYKIYTVAEKVHDQNILFQNDLIPLKHEIFMSTALLNPFQGHSSTLYQNPPRTFIAN